jgi:hypothetical protein
MANAVRSLVTLTETTRGRAAGELAAAAAAQGLPLETAGGVTRAWSHRRGLMVPAAERFLVACPVTPDGPFDKTGPRFAEAWAAGVAAGDGGLLDLGWVS